LSSNRPLAERLASFAATTQYSDLPPELVALVKLHVLDTLGVALGASRASSWPMMLDIVAGEGGNEESTLFGAGTRVPAASAALFNGSLTHALGFDDTHLEALLHPFGAILPAVLAIAERDRLDGSKVIAAVAVGAEVTCRLGIAAGRALVQSAFQPTAVCGSLGAVTAVGSARGLDEKIIANALGLAASMAGGLHESTLDGTWTKQVHAGLAAHVAMQAVEFAEAGVTASPGVLDDVGGLLDAYGRGQVDAAPIAEDLGTSWHIDDLAIKVYPTCQGVHSYVDLALDLAEQNHMPSDDIERVLVRVGPLAGVGLCEPRSLRARPQTTYAAEFSIPYCVASALVNGRLEFDAFTPASLEDERVIALAHKLDYVVDEAMDEDLSMRGWLQIQGPEGELFTAETDACRGTRANPLTAAGIRAKFHKCVEGILSDESEALIGELVARLDTLTDITPIVAAMVSPVFARSGAPA
jgi:2-methylcitrate dehydratase PrpD